MDISNLVDVHTHTAFSPDAENSLEDMVLRAQQLGLQAYAVTDHCDCNFWYPAEHYFEDPLQAVDSIMYGAGEYATASIAAQTELKERLDGRFRFLCGVELGQPLQNIEKAEQIAADTRLDLIIGSHHQNKGMDDFYYLQYKNMDISEIYSALDSCYSEMLDMCKWGKFDVLGHLTYPLRYICGDCGIELDMSRYDDVIREIFCTLIQNGRGIEINSSGLRQNIGKCLPDLEYVKLYRQLGGEILTLGSDAHKTSDLGKGICEAAKMARTAGFRYVTYFKERKPRFIKL